MLCSQCGFDNPAGMKFCGSCAAIMERACPKCNSQNPVCFEYCGHCAYKFSDAPQQPITPINKKNDVAERRQITVLFCDIVNSSKIASNLDPEDLRDILQDYRAICSEIVSRYDGHIAQHLGDGVLVYFGHPVAHEDDASRATRAGLDIIERISKLYFPVSENSHVQLSVRIGIHTGLVVIGEVSGDKRALALGTTPNIASRIQDLADENTVIISSATHQLLRGGFYSNSLGQHSLKGFTKPVELYLVLKHSNRPGDIDPTFKISDLPLIGREQESNLLLESLEQAYKGNKQVVLLNGEPGLGKTRMVQLVYEEAMQKDCELIELRGSPYYKNSFFHPVVKILNHIFVINEDSSNGDKLYQIEKAISLYGLSSNIAVPALSELLSVPLNDKYPADIETTPRQKKQLIMDILIEIILSMTRHRFVLFIVEDLQWIDHSTIEFLIQLINQTSLTNIYCLFTFRSDFPIPLEEKDNTELITLNHLTRKQSGDLIHQFCKFKSLPIDVFSEIVEKTDGIPLYIEEFTKAVLRDKTLIEKDDHYELVFPITQFEIPSTLHDLLMSKLDCLGNEKELAQLCSILGREFSYELLRAVAERDEHSLHIGLNRLIKSEFILQHGQPPKSHYSFRHGLLCDTAYQSLLRRTRQKYHLLISTLIKNRHGYIISENPEIYAHHCTEAGKVGESLKYWLKAGQKAAKQSANREAIAHYSRGLSLLEKLPNTQENQIWELSFQTSLGLANSICKGYAATEVENAYNRAKELCDSINNIHTTFPVLCGLWEFYIVRARLDTAIELGNQLQDIANISKIPEFLLEARRILGTTFFWRGNLSESIQYFELSSNTPIDVRTPAPLSSHCQDSHVAAMANGSCALWLLGNPDQALLQAKQALELSKHLAHPFSQAYALQFLATIHQLRGDRDEVARIADTQITLSEKYQFPFWAATGKMMFAWATSNNNLEISTREFEKAFSNYQQSGNKIARSYFSSLLAQLQNASGDIVAANKSIDQALKECATTNEKYFEAELLRIKGELELTNLNQSDSATAEEYFTKALNTARKQKAISLTLRILVNIFQLIEKNQSKMYHVKMIQDMLIENLQEISEGLDTTDVISAKITLSKIEEWIPPG